ncbi:MAG TPA: cell division protein FtsZ [Burkholderiaceae bacterium]
MSSLMVALGSLGGLVLAGVIAHGAWQARKAGPKRAAEPSARPEPREPVLGEMMIDALSALPSAEQGDGPLLVEPGAKERRQNKRVVLRLDALVDAIAPIAIEAPVSGEQVVAHLPASRRAGGKPFLIEGLNSASGEWEVPTPGERYREFQAGVQLANRTGAMNEIEYSEFVQKTQAFADAIGAAPDFPDMLEAVATARELDHFASQHDAQLAVHLRSRGAAWSVGYIQQHGARHGFVPGVVPGRLVLPAAEEGAPPVLTLTFDSQAALADDANLAAVRDVMLSFDVPQTDARLEPFATWQRSAQALAADMDAAVVDDDGRALGPESFAAIGADLSRLYEQLAARDLAAGSPAARRLFS